MSVSVRAPGTFGWRTTHGTLLSVLLALVRLVGSAALAHASAFALAFAFTFEESTGNRATALFRSVGAAEHLVPALLKMEEGFSS